MSTGIHATPLRYFIGMACVTLLPLCAAAAPAATTAAEAARRAIATNPEVEAAWHSFLAAGDEQDSAHGGYYPSVDLDANVGRERHDIATLGKTDYDRVGASLTVTQLLYDGFATRDEVRRLGRVKRARYFTLLDTAEGAALEAVRAYEDVRRYRELVGLAERNVEQHKSVLKRIEEKVKAGVGRSVDLEQASGRLALARSNLVTEQSNLNDVSARYQRIIGEWPDPALEPAKSLAQRLPSDIGAALIAAYTDSPALAAAVENIEAAQAQIGVSRSRYQPRFDLRLRGEYGEDIDRILGRSTDEVAEVVMTYNLFRGFSDRAAVSQAAHQALEAQDIRDKTCRDVRQTVRIAFNDVQRIREQLKFLKTHKQSTDKARTAYLDQFQIGERTLLDLLDTENEYFEAQRAWTKGSYDESIAQARTLAGIGRIRQAIGISRAGLPTLADLGGPSREKHGEICPAQWPEPAVPAIVYEEIAAAPVAPAPAPTDRDSDGDGVLDRNDLCPGTPKGSAVNRAGCVEKQAVVLHGVNFVVDSAELTSSSRIVLDPAARILRENPTMRVEIGGHTDSRASDLYNLNLSDRRAKSVRDYLVGQGVAASQLEAKGYGESKPMASNMEITGRAQNRRVELRVLHN